MKLVKKVEELLVDLTIISIHTHTHTYTHTHTLTLTHTGAAGGTFAAGACLSARLRDKDDFMNATIGGLLAGTVFGLNCKEA